MAKAVSMEPVPTTTWWIYLLEGIGAVLIGLLLLMAPAATVVAITLFLGFYWLFVGVLELVRMFVDRSVPWYWSLLIGLLLACTAFALAKPFAEFLVGRSIPAPQLERIHAILDDDPAIEEVLSLRAVYSGPEEVTVLSKARPSRDLNIEQLTRATVRVVQDHPFAKPRGGMREERHGGKS